MGYLNHQLINDQKNSYIYKKKQLNMNHLDHLNSKDIFNFIHLQN